MFLVPAVQTDEDDSVVDASDWLDSSPVGSQAQLGNVRTRRADSVRTSYANDGR